MYPDLFQIGPFIISTMWVFVFASVYIFIKLLVKSIQKKRGDFKFLYENSTFFITSFIIGARLIHIIENASYYFYDFGFATILRLFAFWDKGLSFWGGLLLLLISIFYKTRNTKESFKKWLDYLIEPFFYALPIAYIGKFFDGAGYGYKTDLPWGIEFKNMDVSILAPVHPTQIYGALLIIIGIFIARKYFQKNAELLKIPGYKSAVISRLIAFSVFIENLFRGDMTISLFGIRLAIFLSFIIFVASGIFLHRVKVKNK